MNFRTAYPTRCSKYMLVNLSSCELLPHIKFRVFVRYNVHCFPTTTMAWAQEALPFGSPRRSVFPRPARVDHAQQELDLADNRAGFLVSKGATVGSCFLELNIVSYTLVSAFVGSAPASYGFLVSLSGIVLEVAQNGKMLSTTGLPKVPPKEKNTHTHTPWAKTAMFKNHKGTQSSAPRNMQAAHRALERHSTLALFFTLVVLSLSLAEVADPMKTSLRARETI